MEGRGGSRASLQEAKSRDMTSVVAEVVDQYLSLGSQGMECETGHASLWRQLTVQPLQTSSYLTCLIARLVSLDSGHSQRALPDILAELFSPSMLRQDREDFIRLYGDWVKQMPNTPPALAYRCSALQAALLNTIHFVATFYFVRCPKVPRPYYLRWEWVRKVEQQEAEQLVFRMVSQDSHWVNKRAKNLEGFIHTLTDHCRSGYVRGSLTSSIPVSTGLVNHLKVMQSLHYGELCQLLAFGAVPEGEDKEVFQRPTSLAEAAVTHIINLLTNLQISKNAREEQLLPILTLFSNTATVAPLVDKLDAAYNAIQKYYLWPMPYCEVAKEALDFIFAEQRCPGIHFRRTVLAEHSIELPADVFPARAAEYVHMIVDKSAPRGEHFAAAFEDHPSDQAALKRKLLMHMFYSVLGYKSQQELTEMEADLENCHDMDLSFLCAHALASGEEATTFSSQVEARTKLSERMERLKSFLAKYRGRQQRVSTVSRSSVADLGSSTVEEVYSVQAKPMLWFPAGRPHELHVFDGETSDAGGAESALQSILTDLQGKRRKESSAAASMAPTSSDLKHLQALASSAQQQPKPPKRNFSQPNVPSGGAARHNRIFSDSDYAAADDKDSIRDKTASLPAGMRMMAAPSDERSVDATIEVMEEEDAESGSSLQSDGSSKLAAPDYILVESSSSAESTPKATPKHAKRLERQASEDNSPADSSVSEPHSLEARDGDVADEEDGNDIVPFANPESASTTLKRGSHLEDSGQDEVDGLEKEYNEYLMSSSVTPDVSNLRSGSSEKAHSNPASRQSSLAPPEISMASSKSMDFPAERASPGSRFTFDVSDGSGGTQRAARSSTVLEKADLSPGAAPPRKRGIYSQFMKRRGSHKAVLSKKNPVVKIVFAGDDRTVRLMSQAYVQLRRKFKFLLEGLDIRFYYVPLSGAGGGGGLVDTVPMHGTGTRQLPRRFHLYDGAQTSSNRVQAAPDMVSALFDPDTTLGSDDATQSAGDAWFGRYLSNLDGWYERNLMLAIHSSLRVIPQEAFEADVTDGLEDTGMEVSGPTPRSVVSNAVFEYCRNAQYEVQCRLYQAELTDVSGKTETYVFLHRVEMVVPAKVKKLPELKIQVQKVGLDEVIQGTSTLPTAKYWGVRVSNIPHPSDTCPTTIESLGLELSVMDSNVSRGGSSVFRRSLRGTGQHEAQSFHVSQVDATTTSTKDSFCVAIDSDVCCQNIISFRVRPCSDTAKGSGQHSRAMTGLPSRQTMSSASVTTGSPGSRRHQASSLARQEEKPSDIALPIMMFWPPEL